MQYSQSRDDKAWDGDIIKALRGFQTCMRWKFAGYLFWCFLINFTLLGLSKIVLPSFTHLSLRQSLIFVFISFLPGSLRFLLVNDFLKCHSTLSIFSNARILFYCFFEIISVFFCLVLQLPYIFSEISFNQESSYPSISTTKISIWKLIIFFLVLFYERIYNENFELNFPVIQKKRFFRVKQIVFNSMSRGIIIGVVISFLFSFINSFYQIENNTTALQENSLNTIVISLSFSCLCISTLIADCVLTEEILYEVFGFSIKQVVAAISINDSFLRIHSLICLQRCCNDVYTRREIFEDSLSSPSFSKSTNWLSIKKECLAIVEQFTTQIPTTKTKNQTEKLSLTNNNIVKGLKKLFWELFSKFFPLIVTPSDLYKTNSLFWNYKEVVLSVNVLNSLIHSSLEEDKQGQIQKSLNEIITKLVDSLYEIEKSFKSGDFLSPQLILSLEAHRCIRKKPLIAAKAIERCVHGIYLVFSPYLKNLNLTAEELNKLNCIIKWESTIASKSLNEIERQHQQQQHQQYQQSQFVQQNYANQMEFNGILHQTQKLFL